MLLLVSACAGPVPVRRAAAPDDEAACRALIAALPQTLDGLGRRDVEPADALAAAYGDPPVVVTCGVPEPAGFDRFATCQVVNDVDWFVPTDQIEDQGADVVATTVGREPGVELRVPAEHRPPAGALAELSKPVTENSTVTERCG